MNMTVGGAFVYVCESL